jgi:hypothetical protein
MKPAKDGGTPPPGDLMTQEILQTRDQKMLHTLQMSFHIQNIHFDIFVHSYALTLATGLPMHSSMDLLFNQEEIDK